VTFERYAEELIANALARGELDPSEGLGEPIADLDRDPGWWVRAFLHREQLSDRRAELAAVIDRRIEEAVAAATLADARELLAEANRSVRAWNTEAPVGLRFDERSEVWLLDARAGRTTNRSDAPRRIG